MFFYPKVKIVQHDRHQIFGAFGILFFEFFLVFVSYKVKYFA